MKKYSLIYMLTFIFYALVLVALPYITAQTWANIMFYLFIGSCIYQFIYIIYLRKKENVSIGRSIAQYFLYAFGSFVLWMVLYYIDLYINGYQKCAFLGECYETYYGFEAWKQDGIANFICGIILTVFFTYLGCYYLISQKIKKSN